MYEEISAFVSVMKFFTIVFGIVFVSVIGLVIGLPIFGH